MGAEQRRTNSGQARPCPAMANLTTLMIAGCWAGPKTRERATPELPRTSPSHPSPGRTCVEGVAFWTAGSGSPRLRPPPAKKPRSLLSGLPRATRTLVPSALVSLEVALSGSVSPPSTIELCSGHSTVTSVLKSLAVQRLRATGAQPVDNPPHTVISMVNSTICLVPRKLATGRPSGAKSWFAADKRRRGASRGRRQTLLGTEDPRRDDPR